VGEVALDFDSRFGGIEATEGSPQYARLLVLPNMAFEF